MKYLFIFLAFFILSVSKTNAQLPGPVIGTAVAIPAGSFACTQQPFGSPIGISGEPSAVTMCFNYYNIGPINLSYLLVNGLCGPFPLYNSLSFQIFDATGTQFITSGTIVPISNNATISILNPGTWYTICYTWTPNCAQFSACPLIYTSALPIDLLYFNGMYENNKVILKWATATEKDVDRYVIQKSYDGITFEYVTEIEAVGNSSVTNVYQAIDYNEVLDNTTYYKLIEVTVDGNNIEHGVIAVNKKDKSELPIQIFDITGKEINEIHIGVNIIRQGETYYKVVKLQ